MRNCSIIAALVIAVACAPLLATALNVTLVAGTTFAVPCDYTGNGNGFKMAAFEINNPHTCGLVLFDITLTALGSGDDSTAFSEIGVIVDTNTNGVYEAGVDTRYGQVYSAYPIDDGSLTFSESLGFRPGETKRFFVVGKLGGPVLPAFQNGFRTIVSAISATGLAPTGIPTTFSEGAGAITIPTPLRLEYDVSGSGAPYNYDFRLVLDNHDGSWLAGQDWGRPVFGQAAYGAGGTAPFASWVTNPASYPIGPFTTTPWSAVSYFSVSYDAPSLFDNVAPFDEPWIPSMVGDELVWWGAANVFLDEGQLAWSMNRIGGPTVPGSATLEPAYRVGDYLRIVSVQGAPEVVGSAETASGNGFAIGSFDIISHTNAATLSSITVAASGSGDDASAFSDIRLFVDANLSGAFEPGLDSQFGGAFSAYPADDGSLTFNGSLSFNPDETKRLLVVAMLNGATLASFGQTFNTTVTTISATGNMHSGLPTAVMPGIHIKAPTLTLTTSAAVQFVSADAQGPGGPGLSVCEFLFANNNEGTANLDSISVACAGSLFDQTDFSYVGLFLDSNGNGSFDAGDASVAPAVAAFPSDDGTLTFTQAISFAPNQSRRFFLVVRLSGSAAIGADFWCRVAAIGVSGGTETAGIPGTLTECLNVTTGGSNNNSGGSSDSDGGCSTSDSAALGWLAWLSALTLLAWRCTGRVRGRG